jgi:PAS domain S-box-containing protein
MRTAVSKQRAASLNDKDKWFQGNFRLAVIGMKVISPDLRYREVNPAFCRFIGHTEEEVLNRRLTDFALPEDRKWIQRSFQQLLRGEIPFLQIERRFRHKAGQPVWGFTNNIVVREEGGRPRYIIGQVVDISKRKRIEEELHAREKVLQHTQHKLRALATSLLKSGEEVKRNLSRELHDVLAQRLASAGLRLSALKKSQALPPDARKELVAISREVRSLAAMIQDLSRRLHPAILEELGLVSAIEKECKAFSRQRRIPVRFTHLKVPRSLPESQSLCLYRIVQESFQNIAKHARAHSVDVSLRAEDSCIRLVITDDGRGLPKDPKRVKKGLGFISMEERASLEEGRFSVDSHSQGGTRIEVRVPWKGTTK